MFYRYFKIWALVIWYTPWQSKNFDLKLYALLSATVKPVSSTKFGWKLQDRRAHASVIRGTAWWWWQHRGRGRMRGLLLHLHRQAIRRWNQTKKSTVLSLLFTWVSTQNIHGKAPRDAARLSTTAGVAGWYGREPEVRSRQAFSFDNFV